MENHIGQKTYYRWEKEILSLSSAELVPVPAPPSLPPVPTFAEVPAQPPAQRAEQREMIASIRIGKAKADIYSGADADVVKALCQVLKSC